uniref:PGG domain-containing protein n=1 Tax=Chlamydomonas leiostraca TaxID=1034604 RepID=A0A7S0WN16_9CHLO|mmetsp:Transcript_19867/g.50419  ORF Transcript_19867/g.50419 Transcript_19867/m.50419 type:complete len:271 (+) Transcript_19867:96-908(+)
MNDTKHDAVEPRAKHPGLFQKKKNKVQPIDGSGRPVKPPKRKKLWSELESGAWRPSAFLIRDALILQGDLEEVKERLRNTTSTVGIVSALIVTMTFPYIIATPEGKCDEDGDATHPILQAFVILNYGSFALSMGIIAMVTGYLVQLDLCCNAAHTADFLDRFAWYVDPISYAFVLGLFCIIVEAMMLTWCNNERNVVTGAYVVAAVVLVVTGVPYLSILVWNRTEVTKHGNQLMEQVQERSRHASQHTGTKQGAALEDGVEATPLSEAAG